MTRACPGFVLACAATLTIVLSGCASAWRPTSIELAPVSVQHDVVVTIPQFAHSPRHVQGIESSLPFGENILVVCRMTQRFWTQHGRLPMNAAELTRSAKNETEKEGLAVFERLSFAELDGREEIAVSFRIEQPEQNNRLVTGKAVFPARSSRP